MEIEIRPIATHEEYAEVEDLQKQIWGITDGLDIVPAHLLLTAQKNGGLVLGAFEKESQEERLVGFVFGFQYS